MSAEQQIKRIQEKLQQLLKQHAVLQKENKQLKEDLKSAQTAVSAFEKTTDDLKQQVSVLKMAAGEMNAADKKEFEKRLSSYIREIDRCIALLGE